MSRAPNADRAEAAATLLSLLSALAAELPGVSATVRDEGVEWVVAGQPIAVLAHETASFRVGHEIGAAARRTPDTHVSDRGDEWVSFYPPTIDDHARDRVGAWFAAAHRRGGARNAG